MKELRHLSYFESLLREADNPLVQQARAEGMRAVGYTGCHVPEVLLDLGGCFSVRLRAPLEGYGFLDGLVGDCPCEQRKPRMLITRVDVPAKAEDCAEQLRRLLLDRMAEEFGVDTSDAAMRRAVAEHNEVCRVLREIDALRAPDSAPVTGYEYHVLSLISHVCPKRLILPKLRETFSELKRREPDAKPWYRARVALVGGELDDPALTRMIEEAGMFVVSDCGSAAGREEITLNDTDDVLTQICAHDLKAAERARRVETADALARQRRADGVIYVCGRWGFESALASHSLNVDYGWPVLSVDRPSKLNELCAFAERLEAKSAHRETEAARLPRGKERIDWRGFAARQGKNLAQSGKRVAEEARAFAAMSRAERWDVLLHGEKKLGKLRRSGGMAAVRREWRGVGDTAYDFYAWARMWGMFLTTFGRAPLPLLNAAHRWRWMASYLRAPSFADRSTMGQRGAALRVSRLLLYDVFRSVAESLVLLARCDAKAKPNRKIVLFDEPSLGRILAGFPELLGVPYQLLPVLLASELDPSACVPYIDAAERFGVSPDACALPSAVCGAIVSDALPHMGACLISGAKPCDGSDAATLYMARRFPSLPVFRLAHSEDAVEDIRRCIRFIEETTGARWSWDAYFAQMQRFNLETQFERQWRELNQTPYPQLIGPCAELFRRWSRALDCGAEARVVKTFEQVNRLVLEACERREEAWRGRMKYRAITWSCPAHYYADLSAWLANCWGVDVLAELESLDDARALETEDRETALNDLARRGDNNADELWRQCELWKADIVLAYRNVACESTAQGILDEQARQRGCKLVWIEHDLLDPRTVTRRAMRRTINEFMYTVLGATPVDESLVDFED